MVSRYNCGYMTMLLHNCKNAIINVNAAVKKLVEILLSDALHSEVNAVIP